METAVFGMGNFWTAEAIFGSVTGVIFTEVGHINGVECVKLIYDPKVVTYDTLLRIFWRHHDATKSVENRYSSLIAYEERDVYRKKLIFEFLRFKKALENRHIFTAVVADSFIRADMCQQKFFIPSFLRPEIDIFSTYATKLNSEISGESCDR